jgi:hypothetical protein
MSDKSTILKTFNNHFFEFLTDIICIFPENNDIITAKKSFENIKKLNPSIIIKVWKNYVYQPYKEVIEAGNIEFFFDKDYNSDLQTVANGSEIIKMIDVMREPIKNMSDANKEHSMKYIQNLSKLSEIY